MGLKNRRVYPTLRTSYFGYRVHRVEGSYQFYLLGGSMTTLIILLAFTVIGITTLFWSLVGIFRAISERIRKTSPAQLMASDLVAGHDYPSVYDVAVLIAAHNEELVIGKTLQSVGALVPASQIFVASDGSTDRTAQIVRDFGANVLELNPNRGKAGALSAAIEHFELDTQFEVVMLLDADTQLASDYFQSGLPLFTDPEVVAVAGRAKTLFDPAPSSFWGKILVAYRERLYQVTQVLMKYGQSASSVNVVNIVPGFASMYRARVLPEIEIDAPGLTIEDFNMTFEVHAKKLGKIAFHPAAAVAFTQDPDSLSDYAKQVRRWTLGYWQTAKRHGFHYGKFWLVQGLYILELLSCSLLFLLVLPTALASAGANWALDRFHDPQGTLHFIAHILPPEMLLIGLVLPELLLTLFAALMTRRVSYLWMAPFFPLIRILDAYLCLWSLFNSMRNGSNGAWVSPSRRPVSQETV